MDEAVLQSQLSEINERRMDLEHDLKQCKDRRDKVQAEAIKKELRVLANKAKHLLFRLGKYRYGEDEAVEFEPGRYMDANVYHWLKE